MAEWPEWLPDWCQQHLGAGPVRTLLSSGQMSTVFGLRLADGRAAVVKARPDEQGRAAACVQAQAALADLGFACARPLTEATVLGGLAVHAEQWRPGGDLLRGDEPAVARRFGALLAGLTVRLAGAGVRPPLPNPTWVRWDHRDSGTWPAAAFLDERDQGLVPGYVEETARRATARILRSGLPCALGHADWETQNIRWRGSRPWAVHDWDSLAWLPESAIAGAGSGTFASAEIPTLAPIASSREFLAAYQECRGLSFTAEEIEVAWAASLWPAAHNARAQALLRRPPVAEAALCGQAAQRLDLAGA
jgi:hypothetical protein